LLFWASKKLSSYLRNPLSIRYWQKKFDTELLCVVQEICFYDTSFFFILQMHEICPFFTQSQQTWTCAQLEEQEKHIEIQQIPQMKNENENEIL
jgi:hypothetical protein